MDSGTGPWRRNSLERNYSNWLEQEVTHGDGWKRRWQANAARTGTRVGLGAHGSQKPVIRQRKGPSELLRQIVVETRRQRYFRGRGDRETYPAPWTNNIKDIDPAKSVYQVISGGNELDPSGKQGYQRACLPQPFQFFGSRSGLCGMLFGW